MLYCQLLFVCVEYQRYSITWGAWSSNYSEAGCIMMEKSIAGYVKDDEFLDDLRIDWWRQSQAFLYDQDIYIHSHTWYSN